MTSTRIVKVARRATSGDIVAASIDSHPQPSPEFMNITGGALKSRVLRAGTWALGGQAAAHILRLGGNLLLTRLLAPDAFGMMSLATVVYVGIVMLSDFGLQQVIVRSRNGEDAEFLDTVWSLQIMHGAVVATALVAAACGIAA